MTPALALSMAPLAAELLNLLSYRADRIADVEAPPDAEELEALNGEIRRYFESLPRKVDGTAAVLRQMKFTRQQIAAEVKRLGAVDASIKKEEAELLAYVAGVLEQQPAPEKGARKLVGTHSTLMLKVNGGLQSLTIAQPDLVPDDLCVYRGELPAGLYNLVLEYLRYYGEWSLADLADWHSKFTREPSNSLIRAELEKPCPTCDGAGTVRKVARDAEGRPSAEGEPFTCPVCGGGGSSSVPGAHLEPRGKSVVVK